MKTCSSSGHRTHSPSLFIFKKQSHPLCCIRSYFVVSCFFLFVFFRPPLTIKQNKPSSPAGATFLNSHYSILWKLIVKGNDFTLAAFKSTWRARWCVPLKQSDMDTDWKRASLLLGRNHLFITVDYGLTQTNQINKLYDVGFRVKTLQLW